MAQRKPKTLFKVMDYGGALVIEDGTNFYNLDDEFDWNLTAALINRIGTYEDESEFRFLHEKEIPNGKKRRKEVLKILKKYFKNESLRSWWCSFCYRDAAKAALDRGAINNKNNKNRRNSVETNRRI